MFNCIKLYILLIYNIRRNPSEGGTPFDIRRPFPGVKSLPLSTLSFSFCFTRWRPPFSTRCSVVRGFIRGLCFDPTAVERNKVGWQLSWKIGESCEGTAPGWIGFKGSVIEIFRLFYFGFDGSNQQGSGAWLQFLFTSLWVMKPTPQPVFSSRCKLSFLTLEWTRLEYAPQGVDAAGRVYHFNMVVPAAMCLNWNYHVRSVFLAKELNCTLVFIVSELGVIRDGPFWVLGWICSNNGKKYNVSLIG